MKWTEAETEKLLSLRAEKKPYAEISRILGRSTDSCRDRCRLLRKNSKKTEETDKMVCRIKELIGLGYDEKEIADDLGVSKNRVYYLKQAYGIKLTTADRIKLAQRKAKMGKPQREGNGSRESICWDCCRALKDCKKPVEGFVARKVEYGRFTPKRYSYIVKECPRFKPDPWLKEEK